MAGTKSAEAALDWALGQVTDAAVTQHDKGSLVADATGRHHIPAAAVPRVVDTTGAGDAYASGFLAALARGENVAAAGRQGAGLAARVLVHYGARDGAAARAIALPAA